MDKIRGQIPGNLGLRTVRVDVIHREWTGTTPGVGTETVTVTRVLNAGHNPKVEEIGVRDVLASGGLYQAGDYRIGPFTPAYPGGGNAVDVYVPPVDESASSSSILVLLRFDPADGGGAVWCTPVAVHEDTANFRRVMVVRSAGLVPNIALPP